MQKKPAGIGMEIVWNLETKLDNIVTQDIS